MTKDDNEIDGLPSIRIKVVPATSSCNTIAFRIKQTTKLKKVICAFGKNSKMDPSALRFYYEGNRINGNQTVHDLKLTDGIFFVSL